MRVEHDTATSRFLVRVPEGVATLRYSMPSRRMMDIESTFVPSAARGRGVGAALVAQALEHARNEGYQVIPSCWYVKRWVDRHPDYAGLLRER
jgi:predicted GNAT family acetyltransferase